jgi:hypothetical protein
MMYPGATAIDNVNNNFEAYPRRLKTRKLLQLFT